MFAVPREQVRRVHASSGTPEADRGRLHRRGPRHLVELMARSIRRPAVARGPVHVAYGYGLFTGGLGAHYGAERLGCVVRSAAA